jgi:phosphoglycerate dehydrogenase-like enzyme
MTQHPVLFVTHRGERHQQAALACAPTELAVTMRRSPSRDELLALLPDFEFLITERSGAIEAGLIQAGRNLRLIQRLGSQTYDIDLEAARAARVPVCYEPVTGCIRVAEHMFLQILATAKRLREMMAIAEAAENGGRTPRECTEDYFVYNWADVGQLHGLWHTTVGILGMGEIGMELARRLQGWGCTVLYNRRNPMPSVAERDLKVRYADRDTLLAQSDFVCMLLPFLPETAGTLNADFFARLKPGACFVSCGGSGVVVEAAVAEAVRSGHLFGAALDTYAWEPIRPDDPMLGVVRGSRANVVLTPHVAAGSGLDGSEAQARYGDYSNLMRVLQGQELTGRVA